MKNLFVGNMSFQTTEADLRALFEPFGQITRVHIATARETGQPADSLLWKCPTMRKPRKP